MKLTRRDLLEILLSAPLAWSCYGCAPPYPKPQIGSLAPLDPALRGILAPAATTRRRSGVPIVDVHAHFFNASDVPVRGFLQDCLGHRQSLVVRQLIKALAKLAERLAANAPTAADELASLRSFMPEVRGAASPVRAVQARAAIERQEAARRVRDVIRGSEFERLYRTLHNASPDRRGPVRTGPLSPDEILGVLNDSEEPSAPGAGRRALAPVSSQSNADAADGLLGFLNYMLSARWMNIQTYMKAFTTGTNAFGVDAVLGSLVDFDHWLAAAPRSAQEDQITLHGRLRELHGGYFRPVVAYNPWTDIVQQGAALARVLTACAQGFVAVKIYPPIGFRPSGNSTIAANTRKPRPNLQQLDRVLETFFDSCAERGLPVIAHTAHSNGRDDAHDDFGGPEGWEALLRRYATAAKSPIVDLGHFGGANETSWTADFADLMRRQPQIQMYGDLGFWDALACGAGSTTECSAARDRLKRVLAVGVGTQTVADRTMFGTDWLMLAQVKRWPDYPANLRAALGMLVDDTTVEKIFGGNAVRCFQGVSS
jgi:predicted TIM-barrel fold metal-dependent hydrolase